MLRVEYVGCWRVVDNNCVLQVAPNLRKIFDVVALVVVTALTEQPMMHNLVDI